MILILLVIVTCVLDVLHFWSIVFATSRPTTWFNTKNLCTLPIACFCVFLAGLILAISRDYIYAPHNDVSVIDGPHI